MYIAKIRIQGFRCFRDCQIEFQPGVNVIIGENNAGKTTVLRALTLVFGHRRRPRMEADDFHRGCSDFSNPPSITVSVTIRSSKFDSPADQAIVYAWLTKLDAPWEAQLTFRFFLPAEEMPAFARRVGNPSDSKRYWKAVQTTLPKYVWRIYGGNPDAQNKADPEDLGKFECQLLEAIRDVESELFSGTNPLLKSMLERVLDQDVSPERLEERQKEFESQSRELTDHIVERLDTKALFTLVEETGASDGGEPKLAGSITEADLLSALRLHVSRSGFDIPATHNGLGYNNLVYISLILASLEFGSLSTVRGQNAVLFPMLLIEEPEAHLHPALQYRLLKYLKKRVSPINTDGLPKPNSSRQVFLTTHSTHVTAASALDSIVALSWSEGEDITISYPGRVFPDDTDGRKSKKYVERYLDATKSNMLFAKAVILVEGLSELLLMPALSELIGQPIEEYHVAVVAVGGSTFRHFLPLFGVGTPGSRPEFAMKRRVACIVDSDPSRREKGVASARDKKCWPYQLDETPEKYDYRKHAAVLQNLDQFCKGSPNAIVVSGSKTFEYDMASTNPCSPLLSWHCCKCEHETTVLSPEAIPKCGIADQLSKKLRDAEQDALLALSNILDPLEKRRAEFATYYLLSTEDSKGENAFDLERQLRERLANGEPASSLLALPDHIRGAIMWATTGTMGGTAQ